MVNIVNPTTHHVLHLFLVPLLPHFSVCKQPLLCWTVCHLQWRAQKTHTNCFSVALVYLSDWTRTWRGSSAVVAHPPQHWMCSSARHGGKEHPQLTSDFSLINMNGYSLDVFCLWLLQTLETVGDQQFQKHSNQQSCQIQIHWDHIFLIQTFNVKILMWKFKQAWKLIYIC